MRFVVVFDTNVLLSGVGWRGAPHRCIELARCGVIEGVTCQELLDELADKLATKLALSPAQVTDTIADLLTFLRVLSITRTLRAVTADPDDDKVLECAVVGEATHIVTGDRRHLLPIANFRGIDIVCASEFLAAVQSRGAPRSPDP